MNPEFSRVIESTIKNNLRVVLLPAIGELNEEFKSLKKKNLQLNLSAKTENFDHQSNHIQQEETYDYG